jgi:hypothetical protein
MSTYRQITRRKYTASRSYPTSIIRDRGTILYRIAEEVVNAIIVECDVNGDAIIRNGSGDHEPGSGPNSEIFYLYESYMAGSLMLPLNP